MKTFTCLLLMILVFANCSAVPERLQKAGKIMHKRDATGGTIMIEGELTADADLGVISGHASLEIDVPFFISGSANLIDMSTVTITSARAKCTLKLPEETEENLDPATTTTVPIVKGKIELIVNVAIDGFVQEDIPISEDVEGNFEVSGDVLGHLSEEAGRRRKLKISGDLSVETIYYVGA